MTRNSDRLKLNIRGQFYQIDQSLCQEQLPQGLLATLAVNHPSYDAQTGEYFFNRDPQIFNCILSYYVTGMLHQSYCSFCDCIHFSKFRNTHQRINGNWPLKSTYFGGHFFPCYKKGLFHLITVWTKFDVQWQWRHIWVAWILLLNFC